MNTAIVYVLASVGEMAGWFSFWAWLRLGKSPLWLLPGMASLALFAYLLTVDGRWPQETVWAKRGRNTGEASGRGF